MKQWEYCYIRTRKVLSDEFEMILRRAGEQGWELCGFDYQAAWLKRPWEKKIVGEEPTIQEYKSE